ncbi:hypothetical protein VMCG_10647 [Cytospora schulzeri]|uniref:Non-reducing end beta-L-arabinofuranosidase-like GH127 catalytic domain-containing protein n=1 Tax=Cytospora schulzeri TaxID=448051 RepID=A0A423VBI4_9PEZI|nr:hypothetical protein VMCG_10647 [Valsa malicola]
MPLLESSSVGTVDWSDYPDGDPIMLAPTRRKSFGGHAVRATYLLTGVADLVCLHEDGTQPISDADDWVAALRRLWDNMWEGFEIDYFLPQTPDEGGCYAEACASIGAVMLAERLLYLAPDARYTHVMELCLVNAGDDNSCSYHNLLRQFLPSSPILSRPLTMPTAATTISRGSDQKVEYLDSSAPIS